MKAAVFYGKEDIRVEEKGLRELKENEILIKVMACGVCGTDIHIYHGEPGSADVNPPVILGHEYSGEVVQIGEKVKDFAIGDRVTIDPNMFCGECSYCRTEKRHLCKDLAALGVTMDGGFAEYCIVPISQAYKFPETISYEEAAMVEPLACCLHGIDLAAIDAGKTVAIVGGGAIGLMMVQLAKLRGASFIAVSEPMEKRRQLALSLGADVAINPLDPGADKLIYDRYPDGIDVVIECAGKEAAMKSAIGFAKRGATVLLFSVADLNTTLTVRPFEIFQKELTIKGSFINPSTHGRAVQLIASGRVSMKPLISHRFPIEDMTKAIEMQRNPEAVKVIVTP